MLVEMCVRKEERRSAKFEMVDKYEMAGRHYCMPMAFYGQLNYEWLFVIVIIVWPVLFRALWDYTIQLNIFVIP